MGSCRKNKFDSFRQIKSRRLCRHENDYTRISTVNFEGPSLTLKDQSSEIVVDYADTSQNEQSEYKKVSKVVFVLFVSDQGGVYLEYIAQFQIDSIRQAGLWRFIGESQNWHVLCNYSKGNKMCILTLSKEEKKN